MGDGEQLVLSDMQRKVLAIPEEFDIALLGGRGGAKSYTMAVLALRCAEQYGPRAKMLYVRQSHQGGIDFQNLCLDLYGRIYGKKIKFNAQSGIFRYPSGATLEVNQLEGPGDYTKYQGRSFSTLLLDELGEHPTLDYVDRLRSNLRAPKGVPTRVVIAANPGGPSHAEIYKRWAIKAPWIPFLEEKSKRHWVHAPSTFLDNPFISQDEYRRQLEASCPTDPELLRAWLQGDWAINRGAYFAAVLDQSRNLIEPWRHVPEYFGQRWEHFLSMDFGSSAPAAVYLVVKSPGARGPDGRFYPRDSLLFLDEVATNEPGSLNKGMGYTVPILADRIKEMCIRWKVLPQGCADDACFAFAGHGLQQGNPSIRVSIGSEFQMCGVYFQPARKGSRLVRWTRTKRLMADAGKPDVPGLYISRNCEYAWATLPILGRDPKNPEDCDTRQADHAADSISMAVTFEPQRVTQRDMYAKQD